jgi:hypothetical protein
VSDELDSISISLVLDDRIAEGMRRIGQDMALFNRRTEVTAAQMSRIAQLHLGNYLPPEPARPTPVAEPAPALAPRKAAASPAAEVTQAPQVQPPARRIPAPVAAPLAAGEREPPAAISVPYAGPARASPSPATPQVSPPPATTARPVARPAPEPQRVHAASRAEPVVRTLQPEPQAEPVLREVSRTSSEAPAVATPSRPSPVAAAPPPAPAPLAAPAAKPLTPPKIQVALSTSSAQAPGPHGPARTAEAETGRTPMTAQASSDAPRLPPPHTVTRQSTPILPAPAKRASAAPASTPNPAPPLTPPAALNVIVTGRRPEAETTAPPTFAARPAAPLPQVAPQPAPAAGQSLLPPPGRAAPPSGGARLPDRSRSITPPVPALPTAPSAAPPVPAPGRAAADTAATRPSPAPAPAPLAVVHGDVLLDGAQLGRWISGNLARDAARPPTTARGFNTRVSPAWPGNAL